MKNASTRRPAGGNMCMVSCMATWLPRSAASTTPAMTNQGNISAGSSEAASTLPCIT